MGWQWHQLDHLQITWTSLQTDNHASTSPLNFLWAGCSSWCPTNSVKALKAHRHPFTSRKNLARKTFPVVVSSLPDLILIDALSPLLGQKLQIWPNFDYLWAHNAAPSPLSEGNLWWKSESMVCTSHQILWRLVHHATPWVEKLQIWSIFTHATLAGAGISCRRVSVRLSQVCVVLKRLSIESHKQHHMIT